MCFGDVGVRAQAKFQKVFSERTVNYVIGVFGDAARVFGQVGWKIDFGDLGIERGIEEEGDGEAFIPGFWGNDAVNGSFQVTVGRIFQQFADVDNECARNLWNVDPLVVVFNLEAAFALFDHEHGKHAWVFMSADALASLFSAWVADKLCERRWFIADGIFEGVGGRTERDRPFAHEFARDGSAVALPRDRKSTRLNSSHVAISYAVFCLYK